MTELEKLTEAREWLKKRFAGFVPLIVITAPQDRDARGEILHDLFYCRPRSENERLRGKVHDNELLDGDDDGDRDHASEKGERDKLARLRMLRIFPPPEPQPRKSGEHTAAERRENGNKFTH